MQSDRAINREGWRSRAERCSRFFRGQLQPARRLWATALLLLGAGLLVLVAGSYGWMIFRQHQLTSQTNAPLASAQPQTRSDHSSVTLLSIPRIGLRAGILEGTDRKSLLLAPGHLRNTVWPGDLGNSVVAGHRDTFFRRLHELVTGDDIYVLRHGGEYHYVVTRKAVVDPRDLEVTDPTSDSRLTLITCYPTYYVGPAPKRLVIIARLQPGSLAQARHPE